MNSGRLVGASAAAVTAAAIALSVRGYQKGVRLTQFPRSHVSRDAEAKAFAEIPGLEKVTLRTSDGLSLLGWFSPGERRAALVFVHGGAGNRLTLLPEARVLLQHGYGFLVYDSRASGESEGDLVTWGDREQRDLAAALDYVSARPDVDRRRIGVVGFSIGGSTVAMTAARDARARAVILYATWSSLADEVENKLGRLGPVMRAPALWAMRVAGVDVDNVRPIDVIGAIHPRPLLMITGARDGDTPVAVMQQLFGAAYEPKELWVVPGADHGGYFEAAPAEYEARVTAFLDRALFGAEPSP